MRNVDEIDEKWCKQTNKYGWTNPWFKQTSNVNITNPNQMVDIAHDDTIASPAA